MFLDRIDSYVEKIKNIISHFKTNITEELIMYVCHPSRVEKWKYLLDDIEKIMLNFSTTMLQLNI